MKLLSDLHVHSCASVDGRSTVNALIEAAKKRGLAAITVSDHDLCTPPGSEPGILLIPGAEITTANGHILGLFLEKPINFEDLGPYPAPEKAIEEIHACGGLAVLAHPFAPVKLTEEEILALPFDAIETGQAVDLIMARITKRQQEKAAMEANLAIELNKQVSFTAEQVRAFLYALKRGDASDPAVRRGLINIFVNAIYLYDDKMTLILNTGRTSITVDNALLEEIDTCFAGTASNAAACSPFVSSAPPKQKVIPGGMAFCFARNEWREKRCGVRPSKSSARSAAAASHAAVLVQPKKI